MTNLTAVSAKTDHSKVQIMKKLIQQFIKSTNAFDDEAALALFAPDAVMDDISVGEKFRNTDGV